jgi:peptidoglycan/LPS O-acetylase OafA/YrhL
MKLHPSVLLFSAIAALFALTSFLRPAVLSGLASIQKGPVQVLSATGFDSALQSPISLGSLTGTEQRCVNVAFSFSPSALSGHPNILQTADVNSGVRFELHENSLSVVYPGQGGLTGRVLSTEIQPGRWYSVTAEFQSGGYLRATCTGGQAVDDSSLANPSCDRILVGRGFTDERKFEGQIKDFRILSSGRLGMVAAEWWFLAFKVSLIVVGGLAVWWMARAKNEISSPALGRIDSPPVGAIDPLLSIRAFALLQVLMGHLTMCVFLSYRMEERLTEEPWLCLLTPAPWAGVWIFFTLSGYLMGKGFYSGRYTCDPGRVFRFVSNRALRIVPIYASAVLLVSFFVCPIVFKPEHLSLLGSILIFDYDGHQRQNPIGALWSVSTEVQFYALVPLLFWGLSYLIGERHERAIRVSALLLIGGLVLRLVTKEVVHREGVPTYIYTPLLNNLDLFVVGMLANPLVQALRSKDWFLRFATARNVVLLMGGGYLVSAFLGGQVLMGNLDYNRLLIYAPTFAALLTVLIIACSELRDTTKSETGIVKGLLVAGSATGLLAYPFYVWHAPILLAVRRLAPTPLTMGDAIKYSIIATFLTWTVAEFVYRYVELPTEKLKKQKQLASSSEAPTVDADSGTIPFPVPTQTAPASKVA